MQKTKFLLGILAVVGALAAIIFVLGHEKTLVTHPKGIMAHSELKLITTNVALMLSILVPTAILLLFVAWKFRSDAKSKYEPEHTSSPLSQIVVWGLPSIVVAVMAVITFKATHKLDPYRPLDSEVKPLVIQVVALDWKWLFIYPEQGIATLNLVQFPEKVPIQFDLAADDSPMNSFWIPQLSGQIYSMTGMVTKLHIMADGPGEYAGRAAEINGDGYAYMTFVAKSSTQADFEDWVANVKKSSLQLTDNVYSDLIKPSQNNPVALYSYVEKDLFHKLVMKYMHPPHL